MSSITRKTSNSILSIAQTIIEMSKDDYIPTLYNLPYITFSNDNDAILAELNPVLQALVEDEMDKLIENKTTKICTNLTGLLKLLNNPSSSLSEKDFPPSKDITIYFDVNNKFDFATFNKAVDVSDLSFSNLKKLAGFLKNNSITKNQFGKEILFAVGSRIAKLKKEII